MNGADAGRLKRVLEAGAFAVTMEVGPPRGGDPEAVRAKARLLKGLADGFNVTDNQTAVVRMSSIAASRILLEEGLPPIMQMTCRDRNRIALQSDLLGAWALGIRTCLCLSGDHQKAGAGGKLQGHPGARNVFDVDSVQLLRILRALSDQGIQAGGDAIDKPVPMLLGAAWTPLAPPEAFRVLRLEKKIRAGADFIQTQAVYDVPRFAKAIARARERGLTEKAAILPGVIVPRSAGMLRYMHNNVPGIQVPDEMIARMKDASDKREEGFLIALELIEAVRAIPGVRGIHLQAIEAEELLPELAERAGLLPRPEIPREAEEA
ncbi:MAG: methylenetetrahydrofolate reductase [Spartobacteria bacterium]|nr:methylenetetrahydrofolate reductase [Spartobacteria bacterium]